MQNCAKYETEEIQKLEICNNKAYDIACTVKFISEEYFEYAYLLHKNLQFVQEK